MRSDLLNLCVTHNSDTKTFADQYSAHRSRVMQLIESTANDLTGSPDSECSSLVLLGAGNGNDFDLNQLARRFKTLHLVDADAAAVETCVDSFDSQSATVQVHAPADIAQPLLSLTSRDFEPSEENREHCINVLQHLSAENAIADIPEADVVVSLTVFSQILEALGRIIPQNHQAFLNALKAVRIGHLRRMLNMLRPGGVAIFVTDVASSETAPELADATNETLGQLIPKLVETGNFFSGTNPSMVLGDLNILSRTKSGPDTVHTIDPWLWEMGEHKRAVYAFRIQRRLPEEQEEPPASAD